MSRAAGRLAVPVDPARSIQPGRSSPVGTDRFAAAAYGRPPRAPGGTPRAAPSAAAARNRRMVREICPPRRAGARISRRVRGFRIRGWPNAPGLAPAGLGPSSARGRRPTERATSAGAGGGRAGRRRAGGTRGLAPGPRGIRAWCVKSVRLDERGPLISRRVRGFRIRGGPARLPGAGGRAVAGPAPGVPCEMAVDTPNRAARTHGTREGRRLAGRRPTRSGSAALRWTAGGCSAGGRRPASPRTSRSRRTTRTAGVRR